MPSAAVALTVTSSSVEVEVTGLGATGGSGGGGGTLTHASADLSANPNMVSQGSGTLVLANGSQVHGVSQSTTDNNKRLVALEVQLYFDSGTSGEAGQPIFINLINITDAAFSIGLDAGEGVKAHWQGTIGGVECFGILAYPGSPNSGYGYLLDTAGRQILDALLPSDQIIFNLAQLMAVD